MANARPPHPSRDTTRERTTRRIRSLSDSLARSTSRSRTSRRGRGGGLDEGQETKIQMRKYGIDFVRGGSYSQVELPDEQMQELMDGRPDPYRDDVDLGLARLHRSCGRAHVQRSP